MIHARLLVIAAAASAAMTFGFAAPASAAFVRIGSVDVGYHTDRDTTWNQFGGRMEGLRLEASRSDIKCRSIVAVYGNGKRDRVFSGQLDEGRPVYVDLAGGSRYLNRIEFACRSDEFRGGRINIMADVGRYRDEWQRSPNWKRLWSSIFGAVSAPSASFGVDWAGQNPDNWVSLGRESFEGRADREDNFAGWAGHKVNRIALRPIDSNARCSYVRARFGNGSSANLNAPSAMNRGGFYVMDLPGKKRNVVSLTLACHSLEGHRVSIEIFAHK
jgi:hypothetical protein